MRIAFADGEMSNLNADFGQLLCACVCEYDTTKPQGGKIHTFTLHDYEDKRWDDSRLAKAWRDCMEDFDIIVTWNGIRFDVPFLNTRLRHRGMREVRLSHHIDLMYTARFKLRLASATLDHVSSFLGCKVKKTRMQPDQWGRAMGGHRPSYAYILNHCKLDVRVLAEVYDKTRHLIREIK